ncbi:cupin domain-containing protein [Aspergillus undulatus]|uniref:cupin domain-containing protein n=1 Tax=Aspergillus undulatus TaxID=1810928 RepID=UPI003CCDA9B1
MSTSNNTTEPPKNLRPLSRYITTHNPSGLATFSTTLPETLPVQPIPDGAHFSLAYTTSSTPANISPSPHDTDISQYSTYLKPGNSPGLVINSGSVCRIVDMQPNATSPMHRTVSLDYGVVLEGEVELILDSGESRLLKRGDVAVQRGTNHAWRNVSPDGGWARMLYVLLPAEGINVGGRVLGEELGDMGVRGST